MLKAAGAIGMCVAAALALAGCERKGNLRTAMDHGPSPPAPVVKQRDFDIYAAPGDARAVWRPAVVDRRGTVVAPGRAEGEGAPRRLRPAGTF